MKYIEQAPLQPLLKPHIEYYNSMQGEDLDGKQFISLPEGKIGMVFFLGGHSCIQKGASSNVWNINRRTMGNFYVQTSR